MPLLYFFIILLILVLVHEYGHFQTAKWFKMKVDEFAFGFPPRLTAFWHKGTKFSFNLLPLGGYVKIKGEDGGDISSGSFASKSYFAQIVVLVAGIVMNILIAWVLFFGAMSLGMPQATNDLNNADVLITNVAPNSVAEKSGIQAGDIVQKINYEGGELIITDPQTVTSAVRNGQPLEFILTRAGQEVAISIVPENIDGINKIGIELQPVQTNKLSFGKAVVASAKATIFYTQETFKGFINLFAKLFTGQNVGDQVSGPVGIVKQVGQASDFGLAYLLSFAGILSINLAILNLVPFPGLDGGRILFVILDAVTRKRISQKVLGFINAIGIIALLLLMILITVKDIIRL
ncbi:RIP metalloprotease RseP [Candidatus Nomurabacteria bacterium RIFCSPHIGHO2_02_FULL_38_15]|uniref:Zinc metalloprotease n=1 Tax=Candidatus Nomurabacteria bacterium RIFCSPHIGHO2_02_FULL_38_15 TaxID=1801752 RepID=A0A1F6VS87_9BACT|nr:MAG: RIP metalloprotease RseP [Candidatus Nomurabacteria bacterium RIFCSPHIGHO2_02_FULL_38_15]